MKTDKKIKTFIFIFLTVAAGFLTSKHAEAAAWSETFSIGGVYFKIDFDKSSYFPGENMALNLSYMNPLYTKCLSHYYDLIASLTVNGAAYDYIGNPFCFNANQWKDLGTHNFIAPLTIGTNYVHFVFDNWSSPSLRYRGYPILHDTVFMVVASVIDNAQFVQYQNLPTTVTPGQTFTTSIQMKNDGDTTWKASNNYKLGSQNPANNLTWGIDRVNLASDVTPGQTGTFTATFTAPAASGTYNFQWQMLIEGVKWFGAKSDNRTITVACEPDLTPQINTCTTATFDDKCGNLVAGTKTDGFCCPVNSCGSAVDESSTTMPTTNLCSAGNASSVSDVGGDWVWTCSSGCSNEIVANCSTKHTSDLDYTRWREVAP